MCPCLVSPTTVQGETALETLAVQINVGMSIAHSSSRQSDLLPGKLKNIILGFSMHALPLFKECESSRRGH